MEKTPKTPEKQNSIDQQAEIYIDKSYGCYMTNTDAEPGGYDDYKKDFLKIYNILEGQFTSPDPDENQNLNLALTDAIVNLDVPSEEIQKIALTMSSEDVPNFAKQMSSFKILYPDLKTSFEGEFHLWGDHQTVYNKGNRYISSPVLSRAVSEDKILDTKNHENSPEQIIYHDLLKCAFGSGSKNVENFLNKLSNGNYMMQAIRRWPDSEEPIGNFYSKSEVDGLQTLIRELHSFHYQTKSGKNEPYDRSLHNLYNKYEEKSVRDVKTEIETIYDEYKLTSRYSLADRVARSFAHPLGIKNLAEAYQYLEDQKVNSYWRHRALAQSGEIGKIKKGDFIKSVINADYLPFILENGVLSKEYLGVGAYSDCTPLDTDVSKVEEESKGLRCAIEQSSAAAFSGLEYFDGDYRFVGKDADSVFLILKNDNRFVENDDYANRFDDYDDCEDDEGDLRLDQGRYEVFPFVEHFVTRYDVSDSFYEDDYGIRTGLPSGEIDYIATDEKSAEKVVNSVKESGLFIPVTDLDGNIIYNPFGDVRPSESGATAKKQESRETAKNQLFPKIHYDLPPNPTEREKLMERVHLDLDLDTTRKMLFLKDQVGDDAYGIANGALQYCLMQDGSVVPRLLEKDGGNLDECRNIANSLNALPIEKWEQMPDDESEERMLKQVVQKNMLFCVKYFNKLLQHPDERYRAYASEQLNSYKDQVKNGDFNLPDKVYSLKSKLDHNLWGFGGSFYDQDGGFFHVYSPFYNNTDKVECRFYLSPKNVNSMVKALVGAHYGANSPKFYMKYYDVARNDRLVIYTDYAHAEKELEILKNLQEKQPDLFENMGKNPFWGTISGAPEGVYFGEEPSFNSYGGVRGDSFDDAFERWLSAYGMESETEDPENQYRHIHRINFSSPDEISDAMVYHFVDFFKQELMERGIDPNNPCFNKE